MSHDKDALVELVRKLSPELTSDQVLYEIHKHFSLDQAVETGKVLSEPPSTVPQGGRWTDAFGCIVPAVIMAGVFVAMPLLFKIGEAFSPRKPSVAASGVIEHINGNGQASYSRVLGKFGKVVGDMLVIEEDGKTTVIPLADVAELIFKSTDK